MAYAKTVDKINDALISEIVRRVLTVAHLTRVILFESAAVGGMTRDSDIDLLVVDRDPGDTRRESVRIDEALSGLGYLFDVIVISDD